jgi:hypothetical protein
MCSCFVKKFLNAKIKSIGKTLIDDEAKSYAKCIPKECLNKLLVLSESKTIEQVRGFVACLWLKLSFKPTLLFMNCYRLVDIYLGKDEDIPSLSYLDSEILVITWGYNEFKNQRIPDFILHVLEARRDKYNWLIYKRDQENMSSVYRYLEDNDFYFISYPNKSDDELFK